MDSENQAEHGLGDQAEHRLRDQAGHGLGETRLNKDLGRPRTWTQKDQTELGFGDQTEHGLRKTRLNMDLETRLDMNLQKAGHCGGNSGGDR